MREYKIDSDTIYDGKVIRVKVDKVRLPNGKEAKREVVERIDGVSIIPITKDKKVVLQKEYRYASDEISWRFPGGGINGGIQTPKETPEQAAQRELFEETGYKAKNLTYLFTTSGSSTIKHKVHTYLATGLYKPNEKREKDEEELIETHVKPFEEILTMTNKHEFTNPIFTLMVLKAKDLLKHLNLQS